MAEKMTPTETLAFFASVIKSGEPWTATCQQAMDDAMDHLAQPAQGQSAAPAGVPEYCEAIGEAGNRYHERFKYAHPLPVTWRWEELWNVMLEVAAPSAQAVDVATEDRFEQYVKTLIDSAPDVKKLGERLTHLLDDDQFNNIEPTLLGIAAALAAQGQDKPDAMEAIVQHCMVTEAVTPDDDDPYGTISRVIDWHQANTAPPAGVPDDVFQDAERYRWLRTRPAQIGALLWRHAPWTHEGYVENQARLDLCIDEERVDAIAAASAPEGYVRVPIKATRSMIKAGAMEIFRNGSGTDFLSRVWDVMVNVGIKK